MTQDKPEFSGWKVSIEQLEELVSSAKKAGREYLGFGVGIFEDGEMREYLDPNNESPEFKLMVECAVFTLNPVQTGTNFTYYSISYEVEDPVVIDDFPPIPPG